MHGLLASFPDSLCAALEQDFTYPGAFGDVLQALKPVPTPLKYPCRSSHGYSHLMNRMLRGLGDGSVGAALSSAWTE